MESKVRIPLAPITEQDIFTLRDMLRQKLAHFGFDDTVPIVFSLEIFLVASAGETKVKDMGAAPT